MDWGLYIFVCISVLRAAVISPFRDLSFDIFSNLIRRLAIFGLVVLGLRILLKPGFVAIDDILVQFPWNVEVIILEQIEMSLQVIFVVVSNPTQYLADIVPRNTEVPFYIFLIIYFEI